MFLYQCGVCLDAGFLVCLRPPGLDARHAAKFFHALLNILREDCTATVRLNAALLHLAIYQYLCDSLLNHFHLAIVADDRVQVEIAAVLIEHGADAVVRALLLCIADCEDGIRGFLWKIEVSPQFLWCIQLPLSLDRLLLIYAFPTRRIHHVALLMQGFRGVP